MKRILVVDDEYSIRVNLQETLKKSGYEVNSAKNAREAIELLKSDEYNLVIADLMMPGMNGIELMESVRKNDPEIGFLIITAYGTIKTAVEALQKGASDFITKPFSLSHLKSLVDHFFDYQNLRDENKRLKRKLSYDTRFSTFVGKSKATQHIYHQINIVARSNVPVFIKGESGTGKELLAQAIHENSDRADRPFIKVNCSAIPETLFESTLFGHEKGSFTNAIKTYKGLFEESNSGTFLLDEISEMPISMQAKLLRVLQESKITRVGTSKEIPVDVRIIATTNVNINKRIEEQKFRSDLFFRLNVFPIRVPPLRSRREDIPILIEHFIKKFQSKYKFKSKKVDKATLDVLMRYDWPGNVRQLENLIERAILYSGKEPILTLDYFSLETDQPQIGNDGFGETLISIAEMEKKLIYSALKKTSNNRTRAAEILGISVRTLRNKLHQYEDQGGHLTSST
ncbi:MAG: sigma-54-dependent Fis family transcriptional regulator [Candidatus Neomarinimicrobiota bacterium]|nr:MAG: sigma-54-dependent Fis family transcriptional regulator [Candidatus Neomarinimicrobiota bacterium]